ncbi:MAG: DNRLRE domain-containing protein [Chloroflexota bacterium]|nr:DNRLRE domain-containing protein [Chloroflexota bacterium]
MISIADFGRRSSGIDLEPAQGLYLYDQTTTNAIPVDLHQVTRPWTTGMTWNTHDGANPWATAGGDVMTTPTTTNPGVGGALGWYHWYPTRLVQGWVDGTVANHGLLLKATTEQGGNVLRFTSSRDTTYASEWPYLHVRYMPWTGERGLHKFERQRLSDRMDLGVNLANGNLALRERDLQIQGTGLDLGVDRHYSSQSPHNWDFANGWYMGTAIGVTLYFYPDSVTFIGPSGYWLPFLKNGDGSFTAPSGAGATLVQSGDGGYTLTFHHSGERYHFDGAGFLLAHADRNGNRLTFAYHYNPPGSVPNGTLDSITDTQGRVTTFGYNASGYITAMTDPAGRQYQYGYDANNDLVSYTDPAGKVTQFAYDGAHNLVEITDPNGHRTRLAYDSADRVTSLTRVTNPATGAGPTTSFTYNAGHTVVTDANGNQTTHHYDHLGRVTKTVDALGSTTETSYTSGSNVARATDTAGQVRIFNHDTNDNLVSAQGPTGAASHWQYGDSRHPHSPTSYSDPQGNTQSYAYDANGNRTSTTNGLATENQARYSYNANGTLASVTDPRGNVTSYGYDAKGNPTSITPAAPLGATTYAYDALSRVTSITDGKGQRTTFAYDALDRVTQISYADGASSTYGYDADGNLTSLADNTGTTLFTYDALNRATSKALPNGSVISYNYDGAGNLTALTDGGGTVDYAYNAVNLLTTLTEPGGARTTFGYDKGYRRTSTAYPNGVTLTQAYDASGRLTSIVGKNAGGATLTSFGYGYTSASGADTGLRQRMTDTAGKTTGYSYDALNRLTRAQTADGAGAQIADYQYAYDGASNRTSQTVNGATTSYSYNAANQLTAAGGTTYSYDANGNLTGNSAGLALAYNAKNQTTSVTPPGGTALNMNYTGDTQVQRVSAGGSSFTHSRLGLGSQNEGLTTTAYTRDANGQLLAARTLTGTYYYLFDGLGSVVALTDGAGNVVNTYAYDPYGNITSSTEVVPNPWRFGGSYGAYTDSTGLVKIGQRYYDPSVGRWTQQDPKVMPFDPVQANRYSYASCSPVNYTDPTGTISGSCAFALASAVFASGGLAVSLAALPVAGPVPAMVAWGLFFSVGGYGLSIVSLADSCD